MKTHLLIVFIALLGTTLTLGGTNSTANAQPTASTSLKTSLQPNIIVLFADDLGYGELGCQGNSQIPTPHIDSIAANGVRFTDAYVTAPVCSPSRAGLMTGRHQSRFGYHINVMPHTPEGSAYGLAASEITLAEHLKSAGYRTGLIGKWHLGSRKDFNPTRHGFDTFFGFAHEGRYFVRPPYKGVTTILRRKQLPEGHKDHRWTSPDKKLIYHDILRNNEPLYDLNNPMLRGEKVVEESRYLTDAFTDEAVSFIETNKRHPFFLYLAYNAVHSPLQGADAYMKKMSHIKDVHRRVFAAMLANLDDSVGAVLKKVRDTGIEKKTLIFFLSDNGGPTRELTSSNLPLNGGKGSFYEGGIRIPYMVQWKQQIPAGKIYRKPVTSLDIYATAAAAAGKEVKPDRCDGVNLLPFITGQNKGQPHEQLFWNFRTSGALRSGDWKLIKKNNSWQLFNLVTDLGETTDLSKQNPTQFAKMKTAWLNQRATMPAYREKKRRK
jgi:arylsulfatase A-like enzyme